MFVLRRVFLAVALMTSAASAESLKPIVLDPDYDHDRWGTVSHCIIKDFRAYRSCFDDDDDDDNFGGADALGVPEWVAYEIKRFDGQCIPTHPRPGTWITDDSLHEAGIMPDDNSYKTTKAFRDAHRDWFTRGHLATKLHAERLGADAAWNTHTFYNAVPQMQLFNARIWNDLEDLTAAWAQHFGAIWIVTGPIFADHYAHAHLGDPGEFPVAIPDALFKIVIKEGASPDTPNLLAFIYPQAGPGYLTKPYDHKRFLTSVDEIETLTGIDFLTNLPDAEEKAIEKTQATELWQADQADFIEACHNN